MTRRKNVSSTPNKTDQGEFAELVGYTVDSLYNPWDGVDHVTLVRLITWVARCSGLCSMGGADDGCAIYVSVRLGDQVKSFKFDTGEQFNTWAGKVADAWAIKWRNMHPEARK